MSKITCLIGNLNVKYFITVNQNYSSENKFSIAKSEIYIFEYHNEALYVHIFRAMKQSLSTMLTSIELNKKYFSLQYSYIYILTR